MYVLRLRPLAHCSDLILHHGEAGDTDAVTEELDLRLEEFALTALGVQLLLTQASQYLAYVSDVLLECSAEDENIIQEHEYASVE